MYLEVVHLPKLFGLSVDLHGQLSRGGQHQSDGAVPPQQPVIPHTRENTAKPVKVFRCKLLSCFFWFT